MCKKWRILSFSLWEMNILFSALYAQSVGNKWCVSTSMCQENADILCTSLLIIHGLFIHVAN